MANKVTTSINQALVQNTSNQLSSEKTDQIQRVLNLQFQVEPNLYIDNKTPFLHRFVVEGLSPPDFKLTESQEKTIVRLFQKWSLHQEICLIDLLGVDIYQTIGLMKTSLEAETQVGFSGCMYLLYLYLQRNKESYPRLEKTLEGFHYGGTSNITLCLEIVKKQMRDACRLKLLQIDVNKNISNETKRVLKEKVTAQVDECVQSLELLSFLLNLEFGSSLLIDRCIVYFKGANSLVKDHKSTLSHLKIYINYANDIFLSSYKNKVNLLAGLNFDFITLDGSKKDFPKLVDQCKQKMKFFDRLKEWIINDYAMAKSGKLTHSDWLKREGLKEVRKKDQPEFVEVLFKQVFILQTYNCFVRDSMRMIDDVIIPGFIENWTKQENIVIRFWFNLSMVQGDFTNSTVKSPLHLLIRTKLLEVFDPLQQTLMDMYKKDNETDIAFSKNELEKILKQRDNGASPTSLIVRQHFNDEHIKKSDDPNTIDVISVTDLPMPSLAEMQSLTSSFNEKVKSLPQVLKSMRSEFVKLTLELPKEQRTNEFFKQCCFEESLRYCRMAFILNDYKALNETLESLYEFPEQLADFIELEGLDDIFKPTIIPIVEELKVLKLVPNEKKPESKVETKEVKIEPFEFKSKNVRKVIKQLTNAGFFLARQKGSHQIFKLHENGPQVVVPNHDELKTGTLASIQDQANAALNLDVH